MSYTGTEDTDEVSVLKERLHELFTYDRDTGVFVRKIRVNNQKAGTIAGKVRKTDGYMAIQIDGKKYQSHRLAWLYVYGEFPAEYIDHINHNRSDNRLANLRLASSVDNSKNTGLNRNNTTGVTGVGWRKSSNRWMAQIKVEYKTIYLGCFLEFSDAVNARKNAEVLYGFHENHGKDV